MIIAPSILSGDFSNAGASIAEIETSGADWVHLDVMDGTFVPNITFGSKMISDLRGCSKLPFDVHLMTMHPETHIEEFAASGADYITFHAETALHSHRLVRQITERKIKAGMSIIPSTPVCAIEPMLSFLDIVLIMTVNPGFGGQELIPMCLEKVALLKKNRAEQKLNFLISCDGGINLDTASKLKSAGADVLIAGSSFFNSKDKAGFVRSLRETA